MSGFEYKSLEEYVKSLEIDLKNNPAITREENTFYIHHEKSGELIYDIFYDNTEDFFVVNQYSTQTEKSVHAQLSICLPILVYENIKQDSKQRIKMFVDITKLKLSFKIFGRLSESQDFFGQKVLPLIIDFVGGDFKKVHKYFKIGVIASLELMVIDKSMLTMAIAMIKNDISELRQFELVRSAEVPVATKRIKDWLNN